MEKRVLYTVGLSIAILVGYQLIQAKFFPAPPSPASLPAAPAANPPLAESGAAAGAVAAAGGAAAPVAGAPAAAVRAAEVRTLVERQGVFRATFSSWGAAPVELVLLNPRYQVDVDGRAQPIDLVDRRAGAAPLFQIAFAAAGADAERSDFELPPDAAWSLLRSSESELVYALDVGAAHVEKRWQLAGDDHRLGLAVSVENRGDKPLSARLQTRLTGWQDPNAKPPGFFSFGRRDLHLAHAACHVAGKVHRGALGESIEKPFTGSGEVKWTAIEQAFFLSALAFADEKEGRTCSLVGQADGRLTARTVAPPRTIAPGQRSEYAMAVFAGPKLLSELGEVKVGATEASLDEAVDYTIAFIARPMFFVLKTIQRVVINWGVAIIIITLLLKAVMFWPTQQSMKSAKAMARLKPELDQLKARHGDDKDAFSQAQMKLFKERGINPLGGCLPVLLQMPIYIAFYSMLSNAVELYRAPFVGPISDMTAPFWPLALATGVITFVQQKISPQQPDSQQQQMMMYMMPAMITFFTLLVPSGLVLYIFTNTVLTMAQQWWMNRNEPLPPARKPAAAKA